MKFKDAIAAVVAAIVSFGLTACVQLGPYTIDQGRVLYNEAVQRTEAQQLLLNIVRQRYNEPVLFLDVTSISSSATRSLDANLSAFLSFGGTDSLSPGLSGSLEERPVIFYSPNVGEKFVRQVLTPLDLTTLALVLQAGWSIERVLLLVGDSISGIQNSMSSRNAAGQPQFVAFREVVLAFRDLQRTGEVTLGADAEGGLTSSITLGFSPSAFESEAYGKICLALAVPCDGKPIQLRQGLGAPPEGSAFATLSTRSLYSTFYFLAEGVEVPTLDAGTGAAQNRNPAGGALDPNGPEGSLFRVRSSPNEPENASVKVKYRDSWFYIADNDEETKVTFALVSMLLTLQSGDTNKVTPLISLPAS